MSLVNFINHFACYDRIRTSGNGAEKIFAKFSDSETTRNECQKFNQAADAVGNLIFPFDFFLVFSLFSIPGDHNEVETLERVVF